MTTRQTAEEARHLALKIWLNCCQPQGGFNQELAGEIIEAALSSRERERSVNNRVACVSCHQPVQVTALNAVRCAACGVPPLYQAETLVWTDKKPTVAGWYWYRHDHNDVYRVVYVWFSKLLNPLMPVLMASNLGDIELMKRGEWAGPIDPPLTEPQPVVEVTE